MVGWEGGVLPSRAGGIKQPRIRYCYELLSHVQNLEKICLVYGMLCIGYSTRRINTDIQFA